MTATVVKWVLDELGSVVDAQPADHPLYRVDRDNSLLYEGGGTFDMSASMQRKKDDFKRANFVGARYADRDQSYVGTAPCLDVEEVVGIRIEGMAGFADEYGHVDPNGVDGVPFHGTDESLVQQIKDTLYNSLKNPQAGRTDVSFTHLTITNDTPTMPDWMDYFRYDFDIAFDGYEEL